MVTVSIQDLRPDPQDKPTFYLENIYQLLADTNVPRASIPSTVAVPPPFSPPRYAIWVNSLWFSSLALSLTSALLATLLQQWTRRYIRVSQPLGDPQKRARLRQFFFSGVDNVHFLLATDAVPTLLHLSVFLFFAGLLILLKNINLAVFNSVVVWVVFCVGVYGYITFLPVIQPASPHYAPLASLAWQLYTDIQYHVQDHVVKLRSRLCSLFRRGPGQKNNHNINDRRRRRLLKRLEEKAEEKIMGNSLKLDAGILGSLLNDLGEDDTRERFFEAIPDFYRSRVTDEFKKHLPLDFATKFRSSVNQFLDQTLSSDSLSELIRSRRLLTCLKATYNVLGGRASRSITYEIIRSENWSEVPPSVRTGHILRRWRNSNKPWISIIGRCIIARVIAGEGKHDDTWTTLTKSQLGVTDGVLQRYSKHGDSVLLANLINTTRLFFKEGLQFYGILQSISRFNVQDTLPDLQHDFCNLWDEIVQYVQDRHKGSDSVFILQEISHVYNALHAMGPMAKAAPAYTAANDDYLYPGLDFPLCANPQTHLFSSTTSTTQTTVSHQVTAPLTNKPSIELDISHVSQQISPVSASCFPDNSSSLVPLSPLGEFPVAMHGHIPPALDFSYSTRTTTTSHTLATPREASYSDPSAAGTSTSTFRQGKGSI